MNKPFACIVIFVLGIFVPGSADLAFAQAEVANPHGDMDVSCVVCHTEQSWQINGQPRAFDHASTGFVLEGLHKHALCRDCHQEKVFAHVGISCADCHDDFHRGRLGVACEDCHRPQGWIDRSAMQRDHDATALPLVGAHAQVDCEACHSGPVSSQYVGTPSECIFCHQTDYDETINPDHLVAGFGVDCESCHTVFANTWGSGDFRHPESFPLKGGHAGIECSACHSIDFQGLPVDCYSCHQDDYEMATDPDHAATNFPLDCMVCHSTSTWDGAEYNHSATSFPLTGAHVPLDCISCHSTGYTNTPVDCYSCHQTEYDNTTDPGHLAAGFPEDCQACHSTTAWEPANWDHDILFPIYSGSHRQEWNSCTDCHEVSSDYSLFECINCHEHGRTEADNDHSKYRTIFTPVLIVSGAIPQEMNDAKIFVFNSLHSDGPFCWPCLGRRENLCCALSFS
jgi:hypothetical protein